MRPLVIDEFSKVVAICLHGAVFLLLILVALATILGGKKGGMWVMKAVFQAGITMLIHIERKIYLYAFVLIRCMGRYIYRLSRISWMPWSRFREQQSGMRMIRIQRLSTRAQDNSLERPRSHVPTDIDWE